MATAGNGTVVINSDGTLTYTPDPNYCGTDLITYTICDTTGLCDTGIVTVEVICVNDPPIAVDDSTTVTAGGSGVIDVLDNDTDPEGDPLTVTSATADHGDVAIDQNGDLIYTPYDGYCGPDTITYTVCDNEPLCDIGQVFITVECADDVLAIPQGFSPNGDNIGDTWVITGLENYPQASVTIFNRWGNSVFDAAPYINDWKGNTQVHSHLEKPANGTYWYILVWEWCARAPICLHQPITRATPKEHEEALAHSPGTGTWNGVDGCHCATGSAVYHVHVEYDVRESGIRWIQ